MLKQSHIHQLTWLNVLDQIVEIYIFFYLKKFNTKSFEYKKSFTKSIVNISSSVTYLYIIRLVLFFLESHTIFKLNLSFFIVSFFFLLLLSYFMFSTCHHQLIFSHNHVSSSSSFRLSNGILNLNKFTIKPLCLMKCPLFR